MEDKIILDKDKKIDLLVKENNCLKEKNRELEESMKALYEQINEALKVQLKFG